MLTDIVNPDITSMYFERGDTGTVEDIQGNQNMFLIPEVTSTGGGEFSSVF